MDLKGGGNYVVHMSLKCHIVCRMAILRLRATPFVLRVGYNDHKSVLDVLRGKETNGARVPVDILIVEAHWAERHRELIEEATVGRQLVVDCRVDLWTMEGAPALPSGRTEAFTVGDIHRQAKEIVREVLAAQEHSVWTVSPACHIDVLPGPAFTTTLRLLDETIHQSSYRTPWAKIVGTPAALATRESAGRISDELLGRGVKNLVLTVGPIQSDLEGENVLQLVRALSESGLNVHVTHQGAFGLAAVAVGAQSFDGGVLGRAESFDYELQRKRLTNGKARTPDRRGYAAPLLASIPKVVLAKLFQLKAVRAAFECDGPCCQTRLDGAALYPVTHFVVRRSAQVRQVLDVPLEMRLGQVDTLFDQTETIFTAIRGIRRGDGDALEGADLETLERYVAPVISARRQLRHVVESEHWVAS